MQQLIYLAALAVGLKDFKTKAETCLWVNSQITQLKTPRQ